MRRIVLFIVGVSFMTGIFAQGEAGLTVNENDTILTETIFFTPSSASAYLDNLLKTEDLWSENGTSMKNSLERLLSYVTEPFDSVGQRLSAYPFDSIDFNEVAFVRSDSLAFNWLNDSTFIFSNSLVDREPYIREEIIKEPEINLDFLFFDSLPNTSTLLDSVFQEPDTVINIYIDSLFLDSMGIQLYELRNKEFLPPISLPDDMSYLTFLPDTAGVVFSDTTWLMVANDDSPFYILPNEKVADSVQFAIEELLRYTENRDSTKLLIGYKWP